MTSGTLPAWATELAEFGNGDEDLNSQFAGINVALNRARLASFLAEFAEDRDVRDFLALDLLGTTAGLPLSSTGALESIPSLIFRPFRLWEYVWIYKTLGLAKGGLKVLDLGGPGTHLSVLTALAGSSVTSVDINPEFVRTAQECARTMRLASLDAVVGDMRDLSAFSSESVDAVVSCSVLEHLTAADQQIALGEMARVLKPGGLVGLTFDYGPGAPGANQYLPPPHDPPATAREAVRRYSQGGLVVLGNEFAEDPVPGCLFPDQSVQYTVASLFLAKPPLPGIRNPRSESAGTALGSLIMEGLPAKVHRGADQVREMTYQNRRIAPLEEGLAATEAALRGTKDGLASTEANRLWLLGLVQKYEAEGWSDFLLRWLGRWRRRLKGSN